MGLVLVPGLVGLVVVSLLLVFGFWSADACYLVVWLTVLCCCGYAVPGFFGCLCYCDGSGCTLYCTVNSVGYFMLFDFYLCNCISGMLCFGFWCYDVV